MLLMTSFKNGINTINKNWHLILVQILTMLLTFTAFFLIVGIPIGIAFVIFGLDFTEILRLRNLESLFVGSAELLNKYFAMALVLFLSLIIYILSVTVLWVFTIGGVAGVIKNHVVEGGEHFSIRMFFREGKNHFFPVLGFSIFTGTLFIIVAFVLGIGGGLARKIIDTARGQEETLAMFLSIFFMLLLISIGLFLIIISLSVTFYGIAYLVFFKKGAFKSIIETFKYLFNKPSSVGFYVLLMLGYLVMSFIVVFVTSPFTLIPVIGAILALPLQILNYTAQSYMSLVMIASMFHLFFSHNFPPSDESTHVSDTSPLPVEEPSDAPPQEVDTNKETPENTSQTTQ